MAETKKKATKKAATEETVKEETVKEKAPKKAAKKTTKAKAEKAEAKKTKKAVKAEPAKPVVTEAHASSLNVRVTPRKVRLVIDLVRGKDVDYALKMLARVNKSAATPVAKLIKSAAANATNNFGMDYTRLYVAMIQASDGIKMKRYLPRAKGSSSGLVKRTSNIYVTVKERD